MDVKSRWFVNFLLVANVIVVVFIANMVVNLGAQVEGLKDVLATKHDLEAVRTAGAPLAFHQDECTRCHTERRFASMHGTKSDIERIITRMRDKPDSRITQTEADKIHASLMLLRCGQCHSRDMMSDLALLTSEERLSAVRGMAKKSGSGIPVGEAEDILRSYELLLGF